VCGEGHAFDVARQGYLNLLRGGKRRLGGDSTDMVAARRAFLATGGYEPISDAVNAATTDALAATGGVVLDIGCGEGYYTRRLAVALAQPEAVVCGIDVAKPAVALAAAAHPDGWYAVASAFDVPVPTGSVHVALSVFGPVAAEELARVVAPGGAVVAAHPGPRHLWALRQLVYDEPELHEVKDPLRGAGEWFVAESSLTASYALAAGDTGAAMDLLTMTPYRWHAPRDIADRVAAATNPTGGLTTDVDVVVSTHRRRRR
jgi:23S rRNA (guanine745-N1)-methyltransferase